MDVVISLELQETDQVRMYQQMAANAFRSNSAWLGSGDEALELVAVLVPNKDDVIPLVQFALRDGNDGRIRALVDATKEGGPIPLKPIIQSTEPYLKPEFFLAIATHACLAASQVEQEPYLRSIQ
jgi:hypothetical protein